MFEVKVGCSWRKKGTVEGGEGLSKIQPVAKMCRWKLEKSRGKRDLEFGYPSSSFRTIFSGIFVPTMSI